MNVLGVIASPRKRGNCEILIKEISRNVAVEHELSLLRLADFRIQPCRGCYRCLFEDMTCPVDDDLPIILQALAAADALILAVPTYFLGPNALLKTLQDRALSFFALADRIWGKPAVGAALAGIPGQEGHALLGVESFLSILLAKTKKTAVLYGALPGEVILNEGNRQRAAEMGRALLAPPAAPEQPCCPVCGGRTFRFLDRTRVRCMVCSSAGRLSPEPEAVRLEDDQEGMPLFTDREAALEHLEWLRGMVSSYREQREVLKAVQRGYRGMGRFIRKAPTTE